MLSQSFNLFSASRIQERSLVTGRVVPEETLEAALRQVPESVKVLGPLSDFYCELNNPPDNDIELLTEGLDWDTFSSLWSQSCFDADVDS